MNNLIKDIKLILYNKKLIISVVCFIIAICVISGTYSYSNKRTFGIRVGIVNNDNTEYSKLLLNFFKSNESFSELVHIVEDNEQTIVSEFDTGNLDAYIIIPEAFAQSLMDIESTRIKVRINQDKEVEAVMLKAVMLSYEKYVTAVQYNSYGLYKNLKKSGLPRKENIKINLLSSWDMVYMVLDKEQFFDYKVIKNDEINIVQYYICVILYVIILYFSIFVGLKIYNEKKYGVFNLYKVSNGKWWSIIISKLFVMGAILIVFLIFISNKLFQVMNKVISFDTFKVFLLYSLVHIAIMIVLAMIISNKNTYVLLTNASALFIIILGGGIIPKAFMPSNIGILVKYLPLSSYINQICNSIG